MGNKLKGNILKTPNSFVDYTHYYPVYPKKRRVVFLGRLEPLKHPMLFMEAVKLLLKNRKYEDVEFYVVGTGSEISRLKQYAHDQDMRNVVFYGLYSRPWEILRQASVFVSLQTSENYPSQSLIEAMACETGVVVTDVGDTRQLVTEQEGILVSHDNVEVAGAIARLLDNPGLRKSLGENARLKVINNHTLGKFVEWFEGIMEA